MSMIMSRRGWIATLIGAAAIAGAPAALIGAGEALAQSQSPTSQVPTEKERQTPPRTRRGWRTRPRPYERRWRYRRWRRRRRW